MKIEFILKVKLTIFCFIFFNLISCSSEDDGGNMITPPRIETFGNWSPTFSNQTNNFTQTRTGSNGTTETRTINVTSSSNSASSSEIDINKDVNSDGDMLDEINIITITYSADNNLGSHEITEYEILNDVNNYFKIGQNTFFIGRVSADNFLNSITCDGIPANFNHDLTFYSKTENEEIYIEFFNNDSDEFLPGEYVSVFSYLNPYFNNQFDDFDQMGDYIDDNFSNQDYYDLYSSTSCSDSEYKLISTVEVEFQGNYYEVDLEENFSLSVDLENQTYTISITGYIKQDSENLGSEKVELFYKGALNFEVYDSDYQPDEINDFLDPNYNQSIDDLNLNLLYDSKYHLDGRIKNEESGVGYTLDDDIINFVKNDNFYYWTTTGYSSTNGTIKVFNSDILSYQNFQSDIDLEDRGSNISINNDGIYIFETHDGLISKLNFDFNLVNTFNIDNNFGEGFAPENYFSLSTYYERIRVDDIGNVYFLMIITGQDQYGENYRSRYLIKRNISSNETIWSTFLTSGNYDSSFELNFNLNNNQDEIVIYGTSGSTAFIKILNSSSGDVLTDQELYSFSKGSPKLNGFFDDDNSYLFYGSYIVTSRVEKNTYTHSFFYNEQSSQPDVCYKGDKVVGVEKLGENYIFLSSNGRTTIGPTTNHGTYKIEIRDTNGEKLREFDFSNIKIGKPSQLFKLSDNSFIAIGDNDSSCIAESRLLKFNFNNISNSARSISSKKNIFFKKSNVIK